MRWIQRDEGGRIIGHYANEQTYATECVGDDHPDIVAFAEQKRLAAEVAAADPAALEARIAELEALVKQLIGG